MRSEVYADEGGTMSVWIIIVSAFGGGLAGSVLEPLISHGLELARAKNAIKARRARVPQGVPLITFPLEVSASAYQPIS